MKILLVFATCVAIRCNFNVDATPSEEDKTTYCKNHRCDPNAFHVDKQREFATGCRCKPGWAGNGKVCGPDKDLDGWPDSALDCFESKCTQDNCPNIPNSGQEDLDLDGIGDACDPDIDNDGIPNKFQYNPHQINSDRLLFVGDYGIANCCHQNIHTTNAGLPRIDNCPFHSNPDQRDFDSDGVGDICDNCRRKKNPDQYDTDSDGIGDVCDGDIDNDGVVNTEDNCPYVYNPNQERYDYCRSEEEEDLTVHNCPNNSHLYQADFNKPEIIFLNPQNTTKIVLRKNNDGAEIIQVSNRDPTLLIESRVFSDVHFEGTFYVEENNEDDCVGFMFSYQQNRKFYAVVWNKNSATQAGIRIKLINSNIAPGQSLGNSLCGTGYIPNQAKTIWKDIKGIGWTARKPYRFILDHKPCSGLIRLKVFEESRLIVESGNAYDNALVGGRIGVLSSSHGKVIWSDLAYRCKVLEQDLTEQMDDKAIAPQFKCPNESVTYKANFNHFDKVFLGPAKGEQGHPVWTVDKNGAQVTQTANTDPGLLVERESFFSVDFGGTFYVNTDFDDDYFGLVFSYESSKRFYAILWKQGEETYYHDGFAIAAQRGLHIKLVNSTTGPGKALGNGLWHTTDFFGQTTNLWWDRNRIGWKDFKSYRWLVNHRPAIGLIRVKIFENNNLIIDSGNVYDDTLLGGKPGLLSYSQNKVFWTDVTYKCSEDVSDDIWKELPSNKRKILEPVVCNT